MSENRALVELPAVVEGGDEPEEGRDLATRYAPTASGRQALTRADIAGSLYREVGVSHKEATSLVEAVLEEISSVLSRGGVVKLSSFGTFSVRKKKQRIGRNPKTGQEVPILARKVLVFRASPMLKARTLAAWGIPK